MTLTLAAVYAPIGFLGGVTGALFREFAFTLAGAVIISGIVAVTLSPMMCSLLLSREMLHGRFVAADRPRLLAARRRLWTPARALARLPPGDGAVRRRGASPARLHVHEHQGRAGARGGSGGAVRADQGAAIRQSRLCPTPMASELDKAFTSFPETDLRFIVNGRFGPNQGIAGVILKPWNERTRSAQQFKPLMQRKVRRRRGAAAPSSSRCRRCRRRSAACRCRW